MKCFLIEMFPSLTVASDLVISGVQAVITTPSFSVPSQLAANAERSAKLVLEWSNGPKNKTTFNTFATEVVADLQGAIPLNSSSVRFKVWCEKM